MKNWKQIAKDYYLEGLDNESIFEKYGIRRTKRHYSQERVFKLLPDYQIDTTCEFCKTKMIARFVSKNAELCHSEDTLSIPESNITELTEVKIHKNHLHHGLQSYGNAYMTEEGYRISTPECPSCGHQKSVYCNCSNCHQMRVVNSIRAAEVLYTKLESREKLAITDLTCFDTLLFLQNLTSDSNFITSNLTSQRSLDKNNFSRDMALFLLDALEIDRAYSPAGIKMTSINTYVSMPDRIHFKPKNKTVLSNCIRELKNKALGMYTDEESKAELIEVWQNLALDESFNILEYYCEVHGLYYRPGEKTTNAIKKSLRKYGLALTARYIYNSVWYSKKQANESGYGNLRAFNQVYGNLIFWIDDPRARTYTAHPFTRKDGVFSEPPSVSVFSEFFLEPNGIDYLNTAITDHRTI